VNINDMVLVSVDDHVVEPPDLFKDRLPKKYADLAPQFLTKEDGTNVWSYEGSEIGNVALNAVAGRPKDEYGIEPTSFSDIRPGCYDVDERVKDMNANGVLGALCFPSFPQFCGQLFARTEDKDVALAMIRAYNDWHIDEWCGSHPGRFIPLALPAIWDPDVMAAEVRRTAAKGAHAVTFSENPSKLGWPSLHSDHWDPFWKACSEEGVVACMHIGSSSQMVVTSPDAPIDCLITLTPLNIVQAATDLIWSSVFRRFPDVRVALSEGGIGWIPYFLERIDYQYKQHHTWTGQDFGDRLPSEVFDEHVLTCFIDDRFGVASRDFLNMDNVMWECDYPHSDSTWPFSPEELGLYLEGVSDHDVNRMTHLNAMHHFAYDPFSALGGRENCTVGALREQAAGHDVSVRSTRPKEKAWSNLPTWVRRSSARPPAPTSPLARTRPFRRGSVPVSARRVGEMSRKIGIALCMRSPVDELQGAGNGRRLVGRQERHQTGDVLCRGLGFQRRVLVEVLHDGGQEPHGVGEGGAHQTRRNGVHSDAAGPELQRRHLDEHGEARLGGAVRAHAVGGLDRVQARGRHDGATRPHAPGCMLHRQERTDEVDVDHVLPLADVGVDDRSERPDARVGEGDVERSKLVLGVLEQGLHVSLVAHVATPSPDVRTELPGDRCRSFAVDVADHDACSLGHEAAHRGKADTRRAAGDDGVLSCKTSFWHGRRLAAGSSKHVEVSSRAGRPEGEGRAGCCTR
jgi:predicted TIM-barrel fold metal-dependent hydrolase